MKVGICALLLSLLAVPAVNASARDSVRGSLSPVTRVVELLKGLSKQIEKDGDKEENLYETYVCWAKSVIEQKTASNAAASSRISQLETYIADLESGRVELTSERADLEKEIEELMGDLEAAKALRKKEHDDFLEAEDEMSKAAAALKSALDVLGEATKDHKKGVLMSIRARLNGGIAALAQQQAQLKQAVELGERFLTKADAFFLRRVLTGDVPTVDWKKLNRKATFKMAYKARSFKIQDVLEKMHTTFATNLADARKKESNAQSEYDSLAKSKQSQLDVAQSAISKMESENGARGMSKQESLDEVDALKEEVASDEKFISQTESALAAKKEEWKARQELRSGELQAISKAIYILHNDDARDLMKKSFKSQGFVQLSDRLTTEHTALAAKDAAAQLRKVALSLGDQRLLVLAAGLAAPSVKTKFGPVLDAIDKMISILKDQEKKDLDIKQTCESDRMGDTRDAIVAGRAIDDMTDKVTRLTSEIKTLNEEIKGLVADHDQVKKEMEAAEKIRQDEHSAFLVTDKDDKDAAATVKSAKDVLANFYKDNNLVLAQKARQPQVTAGEAPPPPPPTWEADYGGKTGESQGIVAILEMVHADILKDIATAKAEEDASQKEFDTFKAESEKQMKTITSDKNEKEGVKGKKEQDKTNTQKERGTKKGELDAVLEKIDDANPNCEYFEVNYPMRTKNRQIEIDGLNKSKAILQGGKFSEGPDPNREMKPGDAASAVLLQRHRSL
jgi:hypothetical protein